MIAETPLAQLRAKIQRFKDGTQPGGRHGGDRQEVETIQKTLNVVLAEIDLLVEGEAAASRPAEPQCTCGNNFANPEPYCAIHLPAKAGAVEGGREDELRNAIGEAIRAAADDRHACETLKRRLREALSLTNELGAALHGRAAPRAKMHADLDPRGDGQ